MAFQTFHPYYFFKPLITTPGTNLFPVNDVYLLNLYLFSFLFSSFSYS
jgi:hypothetical protein